MEPLQLRAGGGGEDQRSETLDDRLVELLADLKALNTSVSTVREDVALVKKVLLYGNGSTSLITSVRMLETKVENLELSRAAERKRFAEFERKHAAVGLAHIDMRTKIVVALISGVLGVLGGLIPYLLTVGAR